MKKNRIYISICSRNFNSNLLNLLNCINMNIKNSNLDVKVLLTFNNSKKITISENNLIKGKLKKIDYSIIYEKKIGISFVRNKALNFLQLIKFDYACFLDDDCIIKKNFISNHLNFIKNNNCSIVGGPQFYKSKSLFLSVFERNFKKGQRVFWVSTNNVFFKKDILRHKLFFSKNVAKYGYGEDQLFFSKLSKLGEEIKWNNNPVFEVFQKSRNNFRWFVNRNYKYGLTGVLIDKELYGSMFAFFLNILKAIINLFKSFYYLLLIPFNPLDSYYKSLAFFLRFFGRILKIII